MKKIYNTEWMFVGFIIVIMVCAFYDVQVWRALKDTLAIISNIL